MHSSLRLLLIAAGCVLLIVGCSDTSFVGSRVDNFTAYYNTFHNARQSYAEGVESIEDRTLSEEVDLNVYLSLFLQSEGGGGQNFETAIEKAADVLREHPNSKWVDESLMMIGKSYYFQQNYVGAEQKFREVQDLGTKLETEARFWLVRTLVTSGRLGEAERVSATVLGEEEEGTWTARTWLARGEAFVRQSRWDDAVEALSTGLEGDLPRELEARAAFLLGQVHETVGELIDARAAYDASVDATKEYELSFAARLSSIRVQGLAGEPQRALSRLRNMQGDDKNFERINALRVLEGRILQSQPAPGEAQEVLRDVLYGEPPAQGPIRGRAHYALANLYLNAYDDFSQAAAHFDTASTLLQQPVSSGSSLLLTPVAITKSASLGERYQRLAERASDVARMDSLLRLGQLDDAAFRDTIAVLQERLQDEISRERERRDEEASARRFSRQMTSTQQTTRTTTSAASGSGSFLFYDNPTRVQEGKRSFERRWGTRPRVDDWRRRAAIRQQEEAVAQNDPDTDERSPETRSEDAEALSIPGIDISEVPRTPEAQAEMRSKRAVARYELATALFLNAERPDSAAVWYQTVIEEDAAEPVARRALYALAEVRHAQGDTVAARDRYRELIRQYPNSRFAQRARARLGEAVNAAQGDSLQVANERYAVAFDLWEAGERDTARTLMADLAREHATTTLAPRALLAVASISLDRLHTSPTDAPASSAAGTPDSALVQLVARLDSSRLYIQRGRETIEAAMPSAEPSPSAASDVEPSGTPPSPPSEDSLRRPPPLEPTPDGDSVSTDDTGSLQDTTRSLPDTTRVANEDPSTENEEESGRESSASPSDGASPDAFRSSVYAPVVDVLAYLVGRYPNSPYAERATSMATGLAVRNNLVVVAAREKEAGEETPGDEESSTPVDTDPSGSDSRGSDVPGRDSLSTPTDREATRPDRPAYRFDLPGEPPEPRGQVDTPADSSGSVDADTTAGAPSSDVRRN